MDDWAAGTGTRQSIVTSDCLGVEQFLQQAVYGTESPAIRLAMLLGVPYGK
ncbi:hypothetical protein Q31a_36860 [Aureliella helgolandensis]|uniref:Uncharacterized protein n=1 Tax=Aureliella helgolandensis TaxID=2527968 RepID=A0A518G9V8_9BACT|nr:hypothetical protein Q31a_36860 [Aureliella helgolandensis]